MFWILHIACLLFFIPGLLVTIPLHMIFGAVTKQAAKASAMKRWSPTDPDAFVCNCGWKGSMASCAPLAGVGGVCPKCRAVLWSVD